MRTSSVAAALAAVVALAGCPKPTPPAGETAAPPGGKGSFVLLHTNDIHCHFEPTPARWLEGDPPIGGFADLDAYLRTVRSREEHVLLLDAGDLLSGTPLSELELEGVRGGHAARFLAEWGYDAWTLGNHEFDAGFDDLAALVAYGTVPALSANLSAPDGGPLMPGVEPSRVFELGGVKVGVIGVITDDLDRLVSKETWARVKLEDPVAAVTREVERLDPLTDLLVVLSHSGLDADRVIAERVPGIDLVVGGHSHDALREPERHGEVWVVQAGSYARSVGRLDIQVEADAIASIQGDLVNLIPEDDWLPASQAVQGRLEIVQAEVEERYGRVVGSAPAPVLGDSYVQGALGVWIAEQLRTATGADVGFYNSGGIRADLPAGELSYAKLYQVFPFGNKAVTFTMTGAELEGMVRRNAFAEATHDTSAFQCAGLDWSWRPAGDAQEIVSASVDGQPIDPQRHYTVVTNSYLATHMEQALRLSPRPIQPSEWTVLEVALQALEKGPLEAPAARSMRVD